MIALVEQKDGSYVKEERGEPRCGMHFCDKCGDCLACYWSDPCYEGASDQHLWVIYYIADTPADDAQETT